MKITPSKYKNLFALEVETENYTTLVLPNEGGKIVSFFDKHTQREYLLQNPSNTYLQLGLTGDFEKCECSGFDDMFPTIDPVVVDGKNYPDHGEVCRVPFSYTIIGNSLVLKYTSETLGYTYQKTVSVGENGALKIDYAIQNISGKDLKVLWSAHCLVKIENDGKLLLPFEENEPVDCVYHSENADLQTRCAYRKADFIIRIPETKMAKKWYFPHRSPQGYVGYQTPQGERFILTFDNQRLPYLGIWLDYGMVNGTFSVGLEPCSAGYDTVQNAEKRGQDVLLKKDESLRFSISLSVEK